MRCRGLKTINLNFDQAFTQEGIKSYVCVKIVDSYQNHRDKFILKLKENFYGLADADLTWFENSTKSAYERGLKSQK